jgi:hypothetical protein
VTQQQFKSKIFIKKSNSAASGPFRPEQVIQFIKLKKVTPSDSFSLDGQKWHSVEKLPKVLEKYLAKKEQKRALRTPPEESPMTRVKKTRVGAGSALVKPRNRRSSAHKKGSSVAILLGIVLLCLLGGAGAYMMLNQVSEEDPREGVVDVSGKNTKTGQAVGASISHSEVPEEVPVKVLGKNTKTGQGTSTSTELSPDTESGFEKSMELIKKLSTEPLSEDDSNELFRYHEKMDPSAALLVREAIKAPVF